jgi:prophage antirepressor-like protein
MSQLQVNLYEKMFNNKQVRIFIDDNGKIWFVCFDISDILEYSNSRKTINDHVDNEDKMYFKDFKKMCNDSLHIHRLHPDTILIDESGFYSLVLRSKKDNAIRFRRWVTSEVLPSIRKTGQYLIECKQKAIKLDHLKESNKSIEVKTKQLS